ncbi:hypothetical protein [Candidatus Halobonum tyrrellensis]|uniref:Uncharacterized protein n=1 Tax=Candidatus Halobonum tyrrellensis G22 TaxID=1324957 RepID=V4J3X7_9EURY|nr:hypothetical protein [Candidatus Halobonum tyrrellensis]ESP90082.1 hypothetical protein K933_00927 [Candidatus Halobonum tyrrellensis G22]
MVTTHDIRNGIRGGVGRFKREVTAPFTKEELAALCAQLEPGVEPPGSKTAMRRRVRVVVGLTDDDEGETDDGAFSKPELEAIADALEVEPVSDDEPDPLF